MDDDLIEVYLTNCLGEHQREEYRKSLQLFDSYGVVPVFTDLQGIVARHSATNGEIVQDLFDIRIREELREMLSSMFISVSDTTSLEKLNELLYVFKLIENLEDYDEIYDIIFSWEDNATIISRVASKFTTISVESFMDDIQDVQGMMIDSLKELVSKKRYQSERAHEKDPARIQSLKDFVAYFPGNQVAPGFLGSSPDLHIAFKTYMVAYGGEIVSDDVTMTAQNILFFLLLSGDGFNNITSVFDESSKMFRFSMERLDEVRKSIISQAGSLTEYRRVMNEKARLSPQGA